MITFNSIYSQQTIVLNGNGSYSQQSGPQGALRSQRGFYLITPSEMKTSGLVNNYAINSIGFTIGAASDTITKGSFKVYLQNTTDTVSRVDTNWTTVNVSTNSFNATGLTSGSYEWQVSTTCANPSAFSPVIKFSNYNLGTCNPPTNFSTTNITNASATFNWVAPASVVSLYYVEYKNQDSINWIRDSTAQVTYNATGLIANKYYQWRVKTKCSGETSASSGDAFITNASVAACSAPASLSAGTTANTSATLTWSAAAGASYYTIRYRREGTTSWISVPSFTNSYTLNGLTAGTTYEWQVQTNCSLGAGAFAAGSDFTTSGSTTCYAPINLSTNTITDTSAVFNWSASAGAASYNIRYRLKDAISWTNATSPMTSVSNDSLSIPDTTGPYNISFAGGSPFTYSGNGIYVAWEYSNSAGSLSSANTTISTTANTSLKGSSGQDSLNYILSLNGISKNNISILPSILTSTIQRPETRFGSTSLFDSVEVSAVYALGNIAPSYTTSSISALIKNHSALAHTYPVTLTVKDKKSNSIRYSGTQSLTVPADATQLITFADWMPAIIETDSLIVSIPAQSNENVINNNHNYYIQNVTRSVVSYDDGTKPITQAGTDTSSGLVLTRYNMSGCGKINGVKIYLSSSAKGHTVYAVALNASKNIIAQSSGFTPDSTQVNNYHTFYFPAQSLLKNEDYYVGLAQTAGATGYYPVGVQWEGADVRNNAYFNAKLNGDNLTDQPQPGRLMIDAQLIPGTPAPSIQGKSGLCSGTSDTLTAGSADVRFADSVLSYSSQNSPIEYSSSKALGSPDFYPNLGLSADEWLSRTADGGREYLVLHYSNPAPANFIDIYETLNPGAVDTVYVKNPGTSTYDIVYSGTAAATANIARKNRILFPLTSYNVSEVRIAINSAAVPGFNAIDAVGIGHLTVPAAFSNYLWSPGGETSQSKIINSAGTYMLSVTDASGCQASDTIYVFTPVQTSPTISASGSTAICSGDSVTLTSSQLTNNTWSTGATTSSIKVKTAGSYTVSYNDGTGCGNPTSGATVVTVNPLPAVSITGALTICPGSSTTLSAGAGFSSYQWSTGVNTQSATVTSNGTFSVKVTDANGCKATASTTTVFVSNPSPTISGNTNFCPGSSAILDAGAGYSSYRWSTGATTRTITVTTAGTYSVTVTNSNGCSGSASVNTSLYAPPSPAISGNTGFCAGSSTALTANAGYNSYLWSTGETTPSISVSSVNTFTVTVTDNHGCSASKSVSTNQNLSPSPSISGTLSYCGGSSTTLDAGLGYSAYLWSTGATTHSIVAIAVQTYSVTVTDNNGCTGSASATTTTQSSVPATPGPIIGPSGSLCNSSGNVYSISPVTNASYYVWTVPSGATITAGQGSTSITVSYNSSFTSGSIVVAASNACGQSPSISPRTLAVQGSPSVPAAITGQTSGLCGQANKIFSIAAGPSATSYSWTVPSGATIVSGQGTLSLGVTFNNTFTSGNICVKAINACGTSASQCLSVSGTPSITSTISGAASVCSKQKGVAYSTSSVVGATSYAWTVPSQATITSGQGTAAIQVTFGTKGGNVTVKANNACGSSNIQSLAVAMNCATITKNMASKPVNEDISLERNIIAFPNPTSGVVNLKFENYQAGNYRLTVYDAAGKRVYSTGLNISDNISKINLWRLAKGTYILNIVNNSSNNMVKVIIN